jgi:hypothetical protein
MTNFAPIFSPIFEHEKTEGGLFCVRRTAFSSDRGSQAALEAFIRAAGCRRHPRVPVARLNAGPGRSDRRSALFRSTVRAHERSVSDDARQRQDCKAGQQSEEIAYGNPHKGPKKADSDFAVSAIGVVAFVAAVGLASRSRIAAGTDRCVPQLWNAVAARCCGIMIVLPGPSGYP